MGIEAKNFNLDVDLLAYSGIVFTPEQRTALQTSLLIIKEQYRFEKIYVWGKIIGVIDDYFFIQGRHQNELKDRQFLYSKDCIKWNILVPASDQAKQLTAVYKGRFLGDPAHEVEVIRYKTKIGNGNDEVKEENKNVLREEERLAATLWKIEKDASIIPRGAFILQPNGDIERNRTFEGLTLAESGKLENYYHFREPIRGLKRDPHNGCILDRSLQCFDSINDDVPKGWTLQHERGGGLIQICSLKWIGMAFFHIPETNRYGSLYCGIGEENKDLPFML